ncbi:MAG: response regulator, partial [Clostridiales bacterium]
KGRGLYHIKDILDFDKASNKYFKINVYQHDKENTTSIANNDIFSLLQDQYGQIWIGTYHGGVSVIKNPNIAIKFSNYSSDASNASSLSDDRIRKIYKDRENNLWICTVNGLNLLDSKYLMSDIKRFRRFFRDAESVNSLTNNDIFDIHQDLKGTIWVATYGGGLNSINIKSESVEFKHYFRRDGLPSNIISSILEDDDLNLWLGTDNGLVKFSTQNYTTELIEYSDDYGHGVFSEGCKYKSANHDFIFGTQSGFIRFNPDSIYIKKREYPIVLTGFKLFNERVIPGAKGSPLNESINKTKKIVLKYNQNFFGVNFAVMDFNAPDKIQYTYILENYEKEWNKAINSANATYKALSPGEYVFKLKATDSRGLLMDEMRELSIVIKPPFWRTKWAIIAYFLLIIAIIYIITKEVIARREISYENKLSEEKFKFFTNISHEFKTPLTLINNSIEDIDKATVFTKDVRSGIQLIKRNVNSLNGLIEQLISFRRFQKGKIELRVRKIEVVSYLNDIYLSFLPYAEKKGLKFIFDTNIESYEGMLDVRYTDVIINNLLSNAFKHTPSNKKIVFKINISPKSGLLVISIQDQGEGISQEHADKIFERFVFVENSFYSSFKGSGIGLSLAKEMVQLHKGFIKLNSKINEGSTFTVEIPLGDKFYNEQEKKLSDEDSIIQAPKPFQSFIEQIDEQPIVQHKKAANAVKYKLLIIEDNKELREYMHEKLQKDNTVFVAVDGEEGERLAKEVNPDLIITDLKMPKLDGVELTKLLKSDFETSHIPIILLTATSSIESKIKGIDSGADDYITKPFNMEYLKRRIVNIISQRKQLKEKFAKDPGFKPEKLTVSDNDQKLLSKVIELIEKNIKTPNYTIDDIIVELGYSRSIFFKKMKSVSGYPPKEFVRIIKMKKAAELLRDPGASVSEVSFNVGFSDPDYFRKSFKHFFGETPTSYKKKYR